MEYFRYLLGSAKDIHGSPLGPSNGPVGGWSHSALAREGAIDGMTCPGSPSGSGGRQARVQMYFLGFLVHCTWYHIRLPKQ